MFWISSGSGLASGEPWKIQTLSVQLLNSTTATRVEGGKREGGGRKGWDGRLTRLATLRLGRLARLAWLARLEEIVVWSTTRATTTTTLLLY